MKAGRGFHRVGAARLHADLRPGEGRGVAFANSLGTDGRLWDAVRASLPPGTPSLSFDMRGHGLSDGPDGGIEDHAADLAALMDAAGMRGAVVCGVSMGGMVAVALGAARPDLVGGAVLACTGARIGTPEAWADRIEAVRAQGLADISDGVIARWFAPDWIAAHPEEAAGWRLMLERTPPEGYAAACAAIARADLRAAAAGLDAPAICLAGTQDGATPPEVVSDLADRLPWAELRTLPTGHLPPIEAPGAVAAAVADLLARLR